jgi:hypothetical protein
MLFVRSVEIIVSSYILFSEAKWIETQHNERIRANKVKRKIQFNCNRLLRIF